MASWYQLAQLVFASFAVAMIAERVRALHWSLASSDEAIRWLVRELQQGGAEQALAWASARPMAQAARLIRASESEGAREGELRELLIDLRDEATARLSLLRVSATLASTLGLLGGILMLTGALPPDAGLLALQAGAAERLSMQQAIATMAIGAGTSALCFQALALLRPAARRLIAQAQQIVAALA
ncbi:MAG: hypothetical protein JWN48_3547 [Myxococcaceae bacterium]|nr:hypothetical protein [Myxococcaceae bacterium]